MPAAPVRVAPAQVALRVQVQAALRVQVQAALRVQVQVALRVQVQVALRARVRAAVVAPLAHQLAVSARSARATWSASLEPDASTAVNQGSPVAT
jgi:hypothetical protein